MVEERFGVVKLRGEITGYKLASSGHCYFRLKDDNAAIDAVMWKGTISKLQLKPEDGLEVVASGRITTYPGKSSYQIVVDFMEAAGAGALMALLEKRKAQLAAEGLFAAARKKKLPYIPKIIGVVTSPTGAVIRDIIHRISDRFPCHIVVWPVAVQGEGAAVQIAAAIEGFNSLPVSRVISEPISGSLLRPDVIIVARGGGSIEDLWSFNEEIVVRAAANSKIPLISAVGHETDTTLIDYAADIRAPTPTAAAEMAVPVLADLKISLAQMENRMSAAMRRELLHQENRLQGLLRGLPRPLELLQTAMQRLDDISERHSGSLLLFLSRKQQIIEMAARGLSPTRLLRDIEQHNHKITDYLQRAFPATLRIIAAKSDKITALAAMLESMNVQRVLERGFAMVRGDNGKLITKAQQAKQNKKLELIFSDGKYHINSTSMK